VCAPLLTDDPLGVVDQDHHRGLPHPGNVPRAGQLSSCTIRHTR
jgi:hypothetical protein